MRRFRVGLTTVALVALGTSGVAKAATPPAYTASKSVKINVMGEWAHPDDDTSIIGPCGAWHQAYGIRCGIIQVTRGEGGGNAVGQELGPALGLRRENEDRVAHYRSGTMDLFYLDKVDFFYNQSAPLTQSIWGESDTLRRIVRIIRMTQPDVYIGFTPTLAAGHGNHQQAGRFIWEGFQAAADPSMFPDQLIGHGGTLSTWQVKKVFSGGSTAGTGANPAVANCATGFVPAATNLDTVVGVWLGSNSPYVWPTGNVQGATAGSAKSWSQVASEGRSAYPTQSRVMFQGTAAPSCSLFGQTAAFVPFQPNTNPDGSANAAAGRDDAIFLGASKPDPGGLPLGTIEHLDVNNFYNAPGSPFTATVTLRSGRSSLRPGSVQLTVPSGWTVDSASKRVGSVSNRSATTVSFTVTPAADAVVNTNYRISALYRTGSASGYTDGVVRIVSSVEGRFQRWGNWAEYDNWLETKAPLARRLGRSSAVQSMAIGTTKQIPVVLHNWSTVAQSGSVSLTLPADFTPVAAQSYANLAPGAEATVTFDVTNTDATLPASQTVSIPITTTYNGGGTGAENLSLSLLPSTVIPNSATAPTMDGQEDPTVYTGPALDISRLWQGTPCTGGDCGTPVGTTPGDPSSTYAKVARNGQDLYFFVHIRDDYQSYAVTPAECVSHWEADSVEFQIDPRGNASEKLMDTANTFKLGVFPFTNDPTGSNGNGVNGPCWERDADNHQGYSTGPLAATVHNAPNAAGVEVASTAHWVGSNETTVDHSYAGGGYNLEVKIPLADLPAQINPNDFGLNITPYDNDNTAAAGTTTLRHIDMSTRLAWSAFGSVQSDPYRWGRASLAGLTDPGSDTVDPVDTSSPNLDSAASPESIAQSARDGVPLSGRDPASPRDRIANLRASLGTTSATVRVTATGAGTARVYLWSGNKGYIPVWTTSCSRAADPAPDYGLSACAATDGGIPAWGTDMSGRLLGSAVVTFSRAGSKTVEIALTSAERSLLRADGSALVSFENPANQVQALDQPLRSSGRHHRHHGHGGHHHGGHH